MHFRCSLRMMASIGGFSRVYRVDYLWVSNEGLLDVVQERERERREPGMLRLPNDSLTNKTNTKSPVCGASSHLRWLYTSGVQVPHLCARCQSVCVYVWVYYKETQRGWRRLHTHTHHQVLASSRPKESIVGPIGGHEVTALLGPPYILQIPIFLAPSFSYTHIQNSFTDTHTHTNLWRDILYREFHPARAETDPLPIYALPLINELHDSRRYPQRFFSFYFLFCNLFGFGCTLLVAAVRGKLFGGLMRFLRFQAGARTTSSF